MVTQPSKVVKDFLLKCDEAGIDPLTRIRKRAHETVDRTFADLDNKYRTGREGKTQADLADEVYDDVKKGIDEISKSAADWYYDNP